MARKDIEAIKNRIARKKEIMEQEKNEVPTSRHSLIPSYVCVPPKETSFWNGFDYAANLRKGGRVLVDIETAVFINSVNQDGGRRKSSSRKKS
jgi:hypothetical protein